MAKIINQTQSIPTYFTTHEPFLYETLHEINLNVGCHRLEFYALCYLTKGEFDVETNIFNHHVVAPSMFLLGPDVIRKFIDNKDEIEMKVLFFRKEYFVEDFSDINRLDQYEFMFNHNQHVIKLDPKEAIKFNDFYQKIEYYTKQDYKTKMIRPLIEIMLEEVKQIHQLVYHKTLEPIDRNVHVLYQFKMLLNTHFICHRDIGFYAEALNLTPKYLSTVIKNTSGKNASTWIKELLLLESKVLLKNSELTISEIAYKLKFTDASHFGKFFKTQTNQSPSQFRETILI